MTKKAYNLMKNTYVFLFLVVPIISVLYSSGFIPRKIGQAFPATEKIQNVTIEPIQYDADRPGVVIRGTAFKNCPCNYKGVVFYLESQFGRSVVDSKSRDLSQVRPEGEMVFERGFAVAATEGQIHELRGDATHTRWGVRIISEFFDGAEYDD